MNDDELVQLLLSNYREQYALYRGLLDGIHAGLPAPGAAPDMVKIIRVLEERNRVFERIKSLDEAIRNNKVGWDRRNAVNTIEAETLKTMLTNIRQILTQVMDANARLESLITSAAGKA